MSINKKPDCVTIFPTHFDRIEDRNANRKEGTKNSFNYLWNKRKVVNGLLSVVSVGLYYAYLRCWKAPKFYEKNSRAYICLNHLKALAEFSKQAPKTNDGARRKLVCQDPALDIFKPSELKLAEIIVHDSGNLSLDANSVPLEQWKKLKKDSKKFHKDALSVMPKIIDYVEFIRVQSKLPKLSGIDKKKIGVYVSNYFLENKMTFTKEGFSWMLFASLINSQLSGESHLIEHQRKPIVPNEDAKKNWFIDITRKATDERGDVLELFAIDEARNSLSHGKYSHEFKVTATDPLSALRQFKVEIKKQYPQITENALKELDGILQLLHTQSSLVGIRTTISNTWDLTGNFFFLGDNTPGVFTASVEMNANKQPELSFRFTQELPLSRKNENDYTMLPGKMGTLSLEYTYRFALKEGLSPLPDHSEKVSFKHWTFDFDLNKYDYNPLV